MAETTTLTKDQIHELQQRATEAAHNSYSPYSHFRVGAALLLDSVDDIVTGTNVENASYRLTSCAEQSAVAAAVVRFGPAMRLRAVAIANLNGAACMPCGACRQTLLEFAGPSLPIFYPRGNGEIVETTLGALLPAGFALEPA